MKLVFLPLVWCVPAFVTLAFSSASAQSDAKTIQLKIVQIDELRSAINAPRGKIAGEVKQQRVVVVYFWASYSVPCMFQFDNLIKFHHKYQDKGVVCMSVSIDTLEHRRIARRFLQMKKAAFANFLLDDDGREWQQEWPINAIPAVVVYDSSGKVHSIMDPTEKGFSFADVETLVQKLIAK
jgi:thiol-disulfide isomerase/thioredoxin